MKNANLLADSGPVTVEYKIYRRSDLEDRYRLGDTGYRYIFKQINGRGFALGVNCDWCSLPKQSMFTTHIEFFALSIGWEKFTSTGYKSHFASFDKRDVFESDAAIFEYYDTVFRAAEFNPHTAYQPSLF